MIWQNVSWISTMMSFTTDRSSVMMQLQNSSCFLSASKSPVWVQMNCNAWMQLQMQQKWWNDSQRCKCLQMLHKCLQIRKSCQHVLCVPMLDSEFGCDVPDCLQESLLGWMLRRTPCFRQLAMQLWHVCFQLCCFGDERACRIGQRRCQRCVFDGETTDSNHRQLHTSRWSGSTMWIGPRSLAKEMAAYFGTET